MGKDREEIVKVTARIPRWELEGVIQFLKNKTLLDYRIELGPEPLAKDKEMEEWTREVQKENQRLKQWIQDLQSGMYVNCVYCGHRYGPEKDTPVSMSEVLTKHIEECPAHPLSAAKKEIQILRKLLWLHHGCDGLYGDDGEMQCNRCVIDFKRDSAQQIKNCFERMELNDAMVRRSRARAEGK